MTETKSEYRCETCSNNNLELCPFQKWKGIDRPENDMSILMRNNIISAVGCLSHSTIAKWNPTYQDLVDHIRWTQNLWRHGIEIMRKNNLVIASDTPMEKLAFTFYSDLCEIDSRALHLFGEGPGDENYKDRGAIQAREIVPYPRPYEEAIKQAAEANGKKKVLTGLLYAMNDPQLTICDTGYREHSYWTGYIRNLLSALDADKAKEKAGE